MVPSGVTTEAALPQGTAEAGEGAGVEELDGVLAAAEGGGDRREGELLEVAQLDDALLVEGQVEDEVGHDVAGLVEPDLLGGRGRAAGHVEDPRLEAEAVEGGCPLMADPVAENVPGHPAQPAHQVLVVGEGETLRPLFEAEEGLLEEVHRLGGLPGPLAHHQADPGEEAARTPGDEFLPGPAVAVASAPEEAEEVIGWEWGVVGHDLGRRRGDWSIAGRPSRREVGPWEPRRLIRAVGSRGCEEAALPILGEAGSSHDGHRAHSSAGVRGSPRDRSRPGSVGGGPGGRSESCLSASGPHR